MDFTDGKLSSELKPARATLKTLAEGLSARAAELGAESRAEVERILAAIGSCDFHDREELSREHDHFRLVGQDNFRRYLPLKSVRIRVHPHDTASEVFIRVCAPHAVGCRVTVSVLPGFASPALTLLDELTEPWAGDIEFVEESDEQLAAAIRNGQADRVRYAAPDRVPLEVLRAAGPAGACVISVPVLAEGRLECLWYLHEQSVSIDYHRYGNLGRRTGEARAAVL